jgi:hypothetical protein
LFKLLQSKCINIGHFGFSNVNSVSQWLLLRQSSDQFFSNIIARTCYFWWDDDDVYFVQDQYMMLDSYSASSQKPRSTGRNVT